MHFLLRIRSVYEYHRCLSCFVLHVSGEVYVTRFKNADIEPEKDMELRSVHLVEIVYMTNHVVCRAGTMCKYVFGGIVLSMQQRKP